MHLFTAAHQRSRRTRLVLLVDDDESTAHLRKSGLSGNKNDNRTLLGQSSTNIVIVTKAVGNQMEGLRQVVARNAPFATQ